MGKKYLETKKDSLESSILGVWQTAIEEGDARVDGRTKGYKEHRSKLESNRQRREAKKVTKEEVELNEIPEMSDEEFVEFIETLTDEELITLHEGIISKAVGSFIQKRTGLGTGGKKKRADHLQKKATAATAKTKAIKDIDRHKADIAVQKKARKDYKKQKKQGKKLAKTYKPPAPAQEEIDLDEKHDTHVDPKDREELGTEPSDTAKKQKKAKEPVPGQMAEASGDKEAYKKFFDAALKKFKVSSPAELKGDDKKKFFDYIDKNWEGDNEKAEGAMSQVREFKMQSLRTALAAMWGMEEGHNPFKKLEDEKEVVKNGKTDTGKKAAVIDLKPKIKD